MNFIWCFLALQLENYINFMDITFTLLYLGLYFKITKAILLNGLLIY